MIAIRLVRGVTDHFVRRVPEWVSAGILVKFGQTLAGPADTFASSANYDVMAAVASEDTWAMAALVVGCLRIAALTANGTLDWFKRWSPVVRAVTAYLSAFVWCAIAVGMYKANVSATGWGTYSGLLIMDVTMAISVAKEAGCAHRKAVDARY